MRGYAGDGAAAGAEARGALRRLRSSALFRTARIPAARKFARIRLSGSGKLPWPWLWYLAGHSDDHLYRLGNQLSVQCSGSSAKVLSHVVGGSIRHRGGFDFSAACLWRPPAAEPIGHCEYCACFAGDSGIRGTDLSRAAVQLFADRKAEKPRLCSVDRISSAAVSEFCSAVERVVGAGAAAGSYRFDVAVCTRDLL